jgi:hypothetical protein
MDRATIISYLQAAEERVANVEHELASQRGLISSLRRNGQDTSSAAAELHLMEQTHIQYIGDRDRLRTELSVLNAAEAAKARFTETRDP